MDYAGYVGIAISLVALWRSQQKNKADNKPILEFTRRDTDGWAVKNVGKGTALNVLIGDLRDSETWNVLEYHALMVGEQKGFGGDS